MVLKSMFQKVALGAALLLASIFASGANAQENLLGELFGLGVHAYNSGDYNDAVANLTAAVEGGTRDPRVFYFRGLAQSSLGNSAEAQADFDKGAQMEVAGGGDQYPIGKSLERVQGTQRLALERVRKIARIKYQREELAKNKERYEQQSVVQEPILDGPRDPDATSKAVEELVDPTAPVAGGDPFGAEGGLGTGEAEAAPDVPEVGGEPAGGDPFGAGADPGAGEPAPPMPAGGDPFGAGDLDPGPPAGGDPFGGAEPAGDTEPAPPAGGDPFGGAEPAPEPEAPAPDGGDPFGGAEEPAPPAGGDPFGGGEEPAPEVEPAVPAGGDPFGGAEEPAPPAGGDPFGGAEEPAPPAGGDPFGGAEEPAPEMEPKAPAGGDPFGADAPPAEGGGVVDAVIGGVGDALEGAGQPDDRDPFDDADEPKAAPPAADPGGPGADDLFGGDEPAVEAPAAPAAGEPEAPAADPFGGAEPAPAGDDPFGAAAEAPAGADPFGAAAPAADAPEMEEKPDPFGDDDAKDAPADNPASDDPFADAP